MKKIFGLIGFGLCLASCNSTEETTLPIDNAKQKDTVSAVVEEVTPVIIKEKGIKISDEFISKFSKKLALPFNLNKEELMEFMEEGIGDYMSKDSNEFSSREIKILDSIWMKIDQSSEKSRVKEAAFFADMDEDSYSQYLDSASEWDSQYAKGFAFGHVELKGNMKILVWQFRSAYGDAGTRGSFDAYFGSLVKEDSLLFSFDLGYYMEQGDSPMYLETSFLSEIGEDESFKFNYHSITTEEDYDHDSTIIVDESNRVYHGSVVSDSIVLKMVEK